MEIKVSVPSPGTFADLVAASREAKKKNKAIEADLRAVQMIEIAIFEGKRTLILDSPPTLEVVSAFKDKGYDLTVREGSKSILSGARSAIIEIIPDVQPKSAEVMHHHV